MFFFAHAAQIVLDKILPYRFLDNDLIASGLATWPIYQVVLFIALLGISTFLFTGALGLLFHKSWARHIMQVSLIFMALSWFGFLSSKRNLFEQDPIISAAITVAILGCVMGALLFLNNADWVLPRFQKAIKGEGYQEILDQDVWEQKQ